MSPFNGLIEIKHMKHIAVIGGGITGVTTAYALAQQGFSVTLYERHRYAGMKTSYANGGQLSASNAEVWNHWPTLVKGMKWMLHRDAPLLFHPQASWHKWSWLAEFVAQLPHYEANTIHTAHWQRNSVTVSMCIQSKVIPSPCIQTMHTASPVPRK